MACVLKRRFGPQVTSSNPHLTPPSTTPPSWTPSTTIILSWPYLSPSLELTLRAPDIGDDHSLELKRANNESRGGTVMYFRDPEWPSAELLKLGFSSLCDEDKDPIFEFFSASLGDEIGLLDWLGQQWQGLILDPVMNWKENGISGDNSMSFTYRGRIV